MMLRMISDREKCIFCAGKAEKSYSISNRLIWICDRCELLVKMLTYGIDGDCVKNGEPVDEADIPFYDTVEEGKMCAGVPIEALLPFEDTTIRDDDDPPVIPELIPIDDSHVIVVADNGKEGKGVRKKKNKAKTAYR